MEYRFQFNLGGIIDLLSNHTYSSPEVYVRELLQNGVDAIVARKQTEPEHQGEIHIELLDQNLEAGTVPPFTDNGIGLTEDDIHLFLATIGQTSKRDEWLSQRTDFIGQFGVGLLSCFMVCDEVIVTTCSIKPGAQTIEWRGRADGTYSLAGLEGKMAPGSEVRLHCKSGSEDFFRPEAVTRLARQYGGLLPFPIMFSNTPASSLFN